MNANDHTLLFLRWLLQTAAGEEARNAAFTASVQGVAAKLGISTMIEAQVVETAILSQLQAAYTAGYCAGRATRATSRSDGAN